ncbi:response regulator [Ktedonobacter racemifer]|uniref:Two component transcriptional regulator, winged helix family n=1 Tax=Ktedonobacter racemifer DSM 44963 TaxID=485913 RepID=D6TSB4_KTERA|nr:response regulator transcription factor [Ktedonobacter racemifer]EFH83315.1 two component transcriptional regulator, winged helix family [Ktedonobacter racemifer DSM 44963]
MTSILLVEDAPELARAIKQELEAQDYWVFHVGDGKSALSMHNKERPDLVILDWMLPELDGLEVLRRMRQVAPTPVLMLTARSEEIDRVIGLEVGADDYLTKPFSMRELLARVRAMLRRTELLEQMLRADRTLAAAQVLVYEGLSLNLEIHQAMLEGVELDLSPNEFALLHLLLRNPGRAFHRPYLLDLVWQSEANVTERAVDTTVKRLRQKLGMLGDCIETVWGIGYRWRARKQGA